MKSIDVRELLARSGIYRLLALGFNYPTRDLVTTLRDEAGKADKETKVYGDWVTRLSKAFEEGVEKDSISGLASDYVRLFGASLHTPCPPYESNYGSNPTFSLTRDLADVAGFYRAFGLKMSDTNKEMPDHVSAELEFMHILTIKEAYAAMKGWRDKRTISRDAQKKFLQDHLGRWAQAICTTLQKSAGVEFYRELAAITGLHIEREAGLLGIKPDRVDKKAGGEDSFEGPSCSAEACE